MLTQQRECPAISNVISKLESILEGVSQDFYQQKAKHLKEINMFCREITEESDKLDISTEYLKEIEFLSISIGKITHSINSKITRRILFSKWAVNELNVLISNARECLDKLSSYVASGNEETAEWLQRRCSRCLEICREYEGNHRKRIEAGTCYMESSGIYQSMLDSFREVFGRIKSFADKSSPR